MGVDGEKGLLELCPPVVRKAGMLVVDGSIDNLSKGTGRVI